MGFIDYLFDTPGIGGAVACIVIGGLAIAYILALRWIAKAR